ncbi:efflux RND transporter periplasmic adaptor subunit [Magnetospirillum sp. 15-1]|uniref:efflux RND transporter periplasmic adaptor subunit n=1 Tax=Magnetospirillum sp. 15-1 TaxID=1979370 RepID=UPI000BBC9754|nr:efflux RND transporter periplasmic adaptor subunit [Magnetospirillum sp. 15-1]
MRDIHFLRNRRAQIAIAAAGVALIIFLRMMLGSLAVEVAVPTSNVPIRVYGLGTIEAKTLAKLGFTLSGTLTELRADAGDTVSSGMILGHLDDSEQRAKVGAAKAGYDKAMAQSASARAVVSKAAVNQAQKEKVSQRRKALVASGTISEETFGDAHAAAVSAGADAKAASAEVALALATVADAKAQLDLNQAILDHHTLIAPFDGRIAYRYKELGSVVQPGEVVFTLYSPETIWVLAYVDEMLAGGIAVGQSAVVKLRSAPSKQFIGTVARIDVESDRTTEERRIYVACPDCPQNLGEQAEVIIDTALLDQALLVPVAAIEAFDGREGIVWTVENGKLFKRKLAFAHRTLDGRLEVAGGLPEKAQVITRLIPGLRKGRSVSVDEAKP